MEVMEIKLKALTPLWTGGVDQRSDRLHETGLIGSLRWWFEVLVRGLDGKVCDPTAKEARCQYNLKDPRPPESQLCVACYLFGCPGWARKFRLMVWDDQDQIIQDRIDAGQTFILRFIPLRPIRDEEWCLLDAALRLISEYGALGGKIVFKPSEEWGIADLGESDLDDAPGGGVRVRRSRRGLPLQQGDIIQAVDGQTVNSIEDLRDICAPLPHGVSITVRFVRNGQSQGKEVWAGKRHHMDLGLVRYDGIIKPENWKCTKSLDDLKRYVSGFPWRQAPHAYRDREGREHDHSWASLQNFWCVKGRYLARQDSDRSSFNRVIGRRMEKNRAQQLFRDTATNRWLAGRQQESKKVFSFKHPEEAMRTFGFVKPGTVDFEEMKNRLAQVWENFDPDKEFLTGEQILNNLFQSWGGSL